MNKEERGLFEIVAISKDSDEIVYEEKIVAEGEKEALFESDLKEQLKVKGLKREDVHVLVREFGTLPAKEDVKIVKIIGQVGKTILAKEK